VQVKETVTLVDVKAACSVITALMVIEPGFEVPEYEPVPVPVQVEKAYPPPAVACIETEVPESYQPVSPEIVGLVVATAVPAPPGVTERVT
jgi:hypothetical protein